MAHPVELDCSYEETADRLRVFFRFLLVIPHLIFLGIYGIPVLFVEAIAMLVLLFSAKYPEKMWNYVLRYLRFDIRVSGYIMFLTDEYPPFNGNEEESYPVTFYIDRPDKWCWFKFILRILGFVIMLPICMLVLLVLTILTPTQMGIAFYSGKRDATAFELQVKCLRFMARYAAFVMCLTDELPAVLFFGLEEVD